MGKPPPQKKKKHIKNEKPVSCLCCFDDFREVVHDGLDVVFEPLVVVLQQSLLALRENSLVRHGAQQDPRYLFPFTKGETNLDALSCEQKKSAFLLNKNKRQERNF